MLVGGTLVIALTFSGLNYLFTLLRSSGVDEERKRHDKAVEQLQAAQVSWSWKRTECLDWINEDLRWQGHAIKSFRDIDAAMQEYAQFTGHNLDPLGPEPQLADFYHPSARKTARSPSSSWGWPQPALWPTGSLRSEASFNLKPVFCDLISWVFPKSFTAQCSRSATVPAATKSPALWPTHRSISRKSRSSSGGKMRRPQCVSPWGQPPGDIWTAS